MISKNTICLWYDSAALEAATFYAETFPDSAVLAVHRAPGDYPSGKEGDVLTVEFRVMGIPCLGLNGGPAFRHSEAFSFQVATDDQAETDRLWNAIVDNGGEERFHASAIFPEEAVSIEGETRDYAGRFFCPQCGSSVFSRSADEIEVSLGALDAPDQFQPTYELWTIRREGWLPAFPLARHYERDREGDGRSEE